MYDLDRRFPDEDTARAHLFKLRWPDGVVVCPRCAKSDRVYRRRPKARGAISYKWVCKTPESCKGYGFSLTTGTIFEDTKIPLRDWFRVLLLMLTSKKGMSALQIQRTVFGQARTNIGEVRGKGSYETTWYMCHRLRAAMKNQEFTRLMGVVEVEETFVGGSAKGAHRGNRGKKTDATPGAQGRMIPPKAAIVGAIARKGNIVARVIDRASASTLTGFVKNVVSDQVTLVATDQNPGYTDLWRDKIPHDTVNHASGEYVRGSVHAANIESFWSLLKRGVVDTFHKVSRDYLPLYVAEFTDRHKHREMLNVDTFDAVLESC